MTMTLPIPSIGGFSPFPVAIMIPFMEAQSAALARAFGLNYEIGKRTIKSMSNDEFNSLTEEQVNEKLRSSATASLDNMIKSLPQYETLQKYIIQEFKEVEKLKIQTTVELIKELTDDAAIGTNNFLLKLFGLEELPKGGSKNKSGATVGTIEENIQTSTQDTPINNKNSSTNNSSKYGGYGTKENQQRALDKAIAEQQAFTGLDKIKRELATALSNYNARVRLYNREINRTSFAGIDKDIWKANRVKDRNIISKLKKAYNDILNRAFASSDRKINSWARTKKRL